MSEALERLNRLVVGGRGRRDTSPDPLETMKRFLALCEVDISHLKVVHVAGTKGKGSVSAMAESGLRKLGYKTGLFTSPHLVNVRERIKIDGSLISERVFLDHFWPTWERLEGSGDVESVGFFRFLTVMGLRAFVAEKVDVAVVEVGIGGRLDCTNVFPAPVVCAITQLDLDHMALLGDTLALIAAEKAGIIKPGRPVVTIPQPEGVLESVIRPRAEALGAPLSLAQPLSTIPWPDGRAPVLSLRGSFQLENAAIAVALCREFVRQVGSGAPSAAAMAMEHDVLARVRDGLESASWPGRAQTFAVPGAAGTVLHLDGAHTPMSIAAAAAWYQGECRPQARCALVFHCTTDRSPRELMAPLRALLPSFSLAIFCAPVGRGPLETKEKWGGEAIQLWHEGLATTFLELRGGDQGCEVAVCASAEEALARIDAEAKACKGQIDVLITGSLQLVGAVMSTSLFDDVREKW